MKAQDEAAPTAVIPVPTPGTGTKVPKRRRHYLGDFCTKLGLCPMRKREKKNMRDIVANVELWAKVVFARVSIKEMMREFQIDEDVAKQVFKLMSRRASRNRAERIMHEIDKLIGGFGVEAITLEGAYVDRFWQDAVGTFVNMGDTYDATIVYDTANEKFLFTTWGDFYEWAEQQQQKGEYE